MTSPQEQLTELTRRTQENFKHLWEQWSQRSSELLKGVAGRSHPAAAAPANAEDVLDAVFDFAENLIAQQRAFAKQILRPPRHTDVDLGHAAVPVPAQKVLQPELGQLTRPVPGGKLRRRGVQQQVAVLPRAGREPPQGQIHLGGDVVRHAPQRLVDLALGGDPREQRDRGLPGEHGGVDRRQHLPPCRRARTRPAPPSPTRRRSAAVRTACGVALSRWTSRGRAERPRARPAGRSDRADQPCDQRGCQPRRHREHGAQPIRPARQRSEARILQNPLHRLATRGP